MPSSVVSVYEICRHCPTMASISSSVTSPFPSMSIINWKYLWREASASVPVRHRAAALPTPTHLAWLAEMEGINSSRRWRSSNEGMPNPAPPPCSLSYLEKRNCRRSL